MVRPNCGQRLDNSAHDIYYEEDYLYMEYICECCGAALVAQFDLVYLNTVCKG